MISLTHHDVLNLVDVLAIDDLLLLPGQDATTLFEGYRAERRGTVPVRDTPFVESAAMSFGERTLHYDRHRHAHGGEPSWTDQLPLATKKLLRANFAIHNNDFYIPGITPYSGLSFLITGDGLCEKVFNAFKLFRLQGIKQLGYLEAPWLHKSAYNRVFAETSNRLSHSFDVMAIATMIAHNNGLRRVATNTVRIAALTHDVATPAGGDSVKLVDRVALDEDLNYERVIRTYPEVEAVLRKYRVRPEILFETIRNKGVLGQILDIADKLAYVGRDLSMIRASLEDSNVRIEQPGLATVRDMANQHPFVSSIWDRVLVIDGQVVFSDSDRLFAFLKMRTLLFRELYYHPRARFGEYLASRVLVQALYRSGAISRDELVSMTDNELECRLKDAYGIERVIEACSRAGSKVHSFYTREEANAFLASLQEAGNPFALLEDNTPHIKTGTHFKVWVPSGEPQAFSAMNPTADQELREMAQVGPLIHVYFIEGEPPIVRERLAALLAQNTPTD